VALVGELKYINQSVCALNAGWYSVAATHIGNANRRERFGHGGEDKLFFGRRRWCSGRRRRKGRIRRWHVCAGNVVQVREGLCGRSHVSRAVSMPDARTRALLSCGKTPADEQQLRVCSESWGMPYHFFGDCAGAMGDGDDGRRSCRGGFRDTGQS
jgi:hypothetical protein